MASIAETAGDLVTAAVGLAAPTRAASLAPDAPELLRTLARTMQRYYVRVAKTAPWTFGARVDQVMVSGTATLPAGWPRPAAALRVLRLEAASSLLAGGVPIGAGARVELVPYDDRAMSAGDPAVYEFGGRFVGAGNAGDPTSGALTIWYAADAVVPQALTDVLDPTWPRRHNDVLIYELGIYLAQKDGRDADVAQFQSELREAQGVFDEAVALASLHRASRFVPAEEFVPAVPADGGA